MKGMPLRKNLKCASMGLAPPPTGKRGWRRVHGEGLHPGRAVPAVVPDVERPSPGEAGLIRLRRWPCCICGGAYHRVESRAADEPASDAALLIGPTACELTREACWVGLPAAGAGGDELLWYATTGGVEERGELFSRARRDRVGAPGRSW